MTMRIVRLSSCVGALLVAACDLAPVYDPPQFILPDSYHGSAPFRVAQPDQDSAPRGDWWRQFDDPELNRLEDELARTNPTLEAASEAYTQARDLAAEAESGLYSQIGAGGQLSNNKQSSHRLFGDGGLREESSNEILAAASWEPDFWDSIRNGARERKQLAQAGAADLATARLSLQAELASDYIALRGLDVTLDVLQASISSYRKAVEVTRLRSTGKISSGLDLARALNQLDSAEAQQTDTALQRDLMEHAIAVLVGAVPSSFAIRPTAVLPLTTPQIPAGLPSELLQRRPDIARAERQMAAANASIGVSRAAFYPHITFSATAGFEDSGFNLLSLPNSLWSIGAGAVLPLFDGGLRRAELQRSWAQYAETRDAYRATVLAAFQEVEDGLSQTQRLAAEAAQQHEASDQAMQALTIATLLYEDGLDNYLSVSVAQVQALAARVAEVQVRVRTMQAAVSLVRAFGGGWTVEALPTEEETLPFRPLGGDKLAEQK